MSDLWNKHLNLIGIEIEGGWDALPKRGIPPNKAPFDPETEERDRQNLMYDGSVTINGESGVGNLGHPIEETGPFVGEAVSKPLPPEEATDWLLEVYPPRVNDSCGLHVHISLPPPNYQLLMDEEFWEYYIDKIESWAEDNPVPEHFFNRIAGHNGTCRRKWHPDEQLHGGHDTRYSHWNFHAFRSHGTTECRVFPAFQDKQLAVRAVKFTCDLVCQYLEEREADPIEFEIEPTKFEPETKTI